MVGLARRSRSFFWKPYMKNPANPRKSSKVSGEGEEGRLVPTAKKKRLKENPKEPPERESTLCWGRGKQKPMEEKKNEQRKGNGRRIGTIPPPPKGSPKGRRSL
jgi:hypothetical protein